MMGHQEKTLRNKMFEKCDIKTDLSYILLQRGIAFSRIMTFKVLKLNEICNKIFLPCSQHVISDWTLANGELCQKFIL